MSGQESVHARADEPHPSVEWRPGDEYGQRGGSRRDRDRHASKDAVLDDITAMLDDRRQGYERPDDSRQLARDIYAEVRGFVLGGLRARLDSALTSAERSTRI